MTDITGRDGMDEPSPQKNDVTGGGSQNCESDDAAEETNSQTDIGESPPQSNAGHTPADDNIAPDAEPTPPTDEPEVNEDYIDTVPLPPPPHQNKKNRWLTFGIFVVFSAMIILANIVVVSVLHDYRFANMDTTLDSERVELVFKRVVAGEPWAWYFVLMLFLRGAFFWTGIAVIVYAIVVKTLRRPIIPDHWQHLPQWPLGDVILITIISHVIIYAMAILYIEPDGREFSHLAAPVLLHAATIGFIYLAARLRQRDAAPALGIRRENLATALRVGFFAFVARMAVIRGFHFLNQGVFDGFFSSFISGEFPMMMSVYLSPGGVASIIILAVIFGPIAEEFLYRSYIQGMLREYCGPTLAILAASLLFAASHFNLSGFPQYFISGVFMGYVYNRTQNIAAPIFMHILWNGYVTATNVLIALQYA